MVEAIMGIVGLYKSRKDISHDVNVLTIVAKTPAYLLPVVAQSALSSLLLAACIDVPCAKCLVTLQSLMTWNVSFHLKLGDSHGAKTFMRNVPLGLCIFIVNINVPPLFYLCRTVFL